MINHRKRHLGFLVAVAALCGAAGLAPGAVPAASAATGGSLGPDVYVFTPGMSQSSIQATLNSIAGQQVPNQFGTQRYALLFEPGTYGSAASPLDFTVGY